MRACMRACGHAYQHACVSFPFRCVSCIERCRLSILQVLYTRTATKALAVSECRMQLPHVCRLRSRSSVTRKDNSPFEICSKRGSCLLSSPIYSWKLRVRKGQTARSDMWLSLILRKRRINFLAEVSYSLRSQTCPKVKI